MAATPQPLVFDTDFTPETGHPVAVAPGVTRVTAPNAGPYTFTGTNSFIFGRERVAVLDPGPDDDRHLAALTAAIAGRPVEAILLSHTHRDHSALATRLKEATGAPLWFAGPHRLSRAPHWLERNVLARDCDWTLTPDRVLEDGEVFAAGGVGLRAIATPGHCANHLCFGLEGGETLLSGDHVMGWNSTLVAVPDGSMADYLGSLEKVIALPYRRYLPAHGGPIADGPDHAQALLAHRQARNAQVVAAVGAGATSIGALLQAIYPTLALVLRPAARMVLQAHVEYLAARGEIKARRGLFGLRLGRGP